MASVTLENRESEPTHIECERRNTERAQLVVRVEYSTIDDFFSEFSRDINQGGLFIETSQPLSLGAEVMMRFNLPGGDEVIETVGHVVRISLGDREEPPGMGLEFEKLRADDRVRIDQLVRMLRA
jgi:type IV pilus assembly protein PilZ